MFHVMQVWVIAGILGTALTVVLGICALAAYLFGVRKERKWGVPALLLLVLAAVASLVLPRVGVGQGQRFDFPPNESVRLIIGGLKDQLPDQPRVLVFYRPHVQDPALGTPSRAITQGQKQAVELGMTKSTVDARLVGFEPPEGISPGFMEDSPTAENINPVLERYREKGVDLVVLLFGLPGALQEEWDLDRLVCHQWSDSPLVAVAAGAFYEPRILREYFREGWLDAAVISPTAEEETEFLVTRRNLADIPSSSPMGGL